MNSEHQVDDKVCLRQGKKKISGVSFTMIVLGEYCRQHMHTIQVFLTSTDHQYMVFIVCKQLYNKLNKNNSIEE